MTRVSFADKPETLTGLTSYLLSQTAKLAKRDLDRRLADRGLRLRHMAVLSAVGEGPAGQLELSRRLDMDPSDMTATVDDLEGRGYVGRTVDPRDRRRKLVTITRAGRSELVRIETVARELTDTLLAPLPARRRRQLHDDLHHVLLAHDARERDTGDRRG